MPILRMFQGGCAVFAPRRANRFEIAAQESGQDTFSASIALAAGRTITMAAQESGSDTFSATLLTGRVFTMAAQESGQDTFSATITSGRVFSMAAQEAGSDTFSATLARGRIFSMAAQESGVDTFSASMSVTAGAINPVISTATFTNTEDGTRDSLAVTGTYAGADTIDATLEFYDGVTLRATATVLGLTVTTGNFNFTENIDPSDLTYEAGSSATDMPSVDNIDATIFERNNGGTATDNVTGVTGLDVIAPTFSSAEIGNVDDTSLIVTFSEEMRGSTSAADWDVQVNASPATESSVAFTPGATTADITLGAAVSNGDTVTVAYTGSGLTDEDGNALATFTAQSVTNNVAAGPTVPSAFVDADWSVATGSGAGELDVTIASLPSDGGATITDVEYDLDASGTWVSSGGTTSFTISGLTASTSYAVRLRAVNSVGNSAAGNSESATSGAAATFAPVFDDWVLNDFDVEGSAAGEQTFATTVSATGDVLVFVSGVLQSATTITGATIGGNTLTAVQAVVTGDGNVIWVGKGTMVGATGSDVVVTTDAGNQNNFFESACAVIDIDGAAASATDSALVTGADDTAASDVSVDTNAGDAVIAFWHGRRFSGGVNVTWAMDPAGDNITPTETEDIGTSVSSQAWEVAIGTGFTAGTPKSITATPASTQARACAAVSIGAA